MQPKPFKVKINMDVTAVIKADTPQDAERIMLAILVEKVLQKNVVDTLDPLVVDTIELKEAVNAEEDNH